MVDKSGGSFVPTNHIPYRGQYTYLYILLSGILRDKTMEDKLMYSPNDDSKNYPFYSLN